MQIQALVIDTDGTQRLETVEVPELKELADYIERM